MSSDQMMMISLEELVSQDHQYHKFKILFIFKAVEEELLAVECGGNYKGYGILRLFKCLLLQFMEDLTDRELERYLADSTAAKWFYDFALTEKTPDYSIFSKIRKKIGINLLPKIFRKFRNQLRTQGYMSEVFTFVDASHLISKANLVDIKGKITNEFYKWMINKLVELVNSVTVELQNYEYANAMHLTENFFWSIFCDNCLEISKTRAYDEENKNPSGRYSSILTLYHIMQTLLTLFTPFLPHITEELYQILYSDGNSIHVKNNWVNYSGLNYEIDAKGTEGLLEILDYVRKFKAEKNLSIKAGVKLLEVRGIELSEELEEDLKNVTSAEEIKFEQKDEGIKVEIMGVLKDRF